MERLDILVSSQDKNGKWRTTKVGSAFPRDDGSVGLVLDAGVAIFGGLEGVKINLRKPLPPRGDRGDRGEQQSGGDTPF